MIEFEYNDQKWMVRDIPPLKAWHIVRRCLPIIKTLGAVFLDEKTAALFKTVGEKAENESADALVTQPGRLVDMLSSFEPVMEGLANLPDTEMEYVIEGCLANVKVYQQNGLWVDVYNSRAKGFQVQLSPSDMLSITVRVLMEIVPDFLGQRGFKSTLQTP
jgi:hypothetical protein